MAQGFHSFLALWIGGGGTDGEAPPPELVSEISDISLAFASDHGPIHLLPHEWRQIKAIRAIAKRDARSAATALRGWKRRTLSAHARLQVQGTA